MPRSPRSSRRFPHRELAIQWDCSTELQDAYGSIPGFPLEGAIERNLAEVRNLSPHIPAEVALGYHLCFGTLGGWPRFQPDDLGQAVEARQCLHRRVRPPGRLDPHPGARPQRRRLFRAAEASFQPQGARVYLGAIHNMERFEERIATARKYLPEFGLGAYCGFGRLPPSALPSILADHLKAVEIVARR